MNKRNQIINRLKMCIETHKDFYERHPNYLENITNKIAALENGAKYEIKDAGWTIPYIWGNCVGCQMISVDGKIYLNDVKEQEMTVEMAKQRYQEILDRRCCL